MTRLAVLADVHGNVPALEAVLADVKAAGAGAMVNLGDCISGPLWPAESCAALMATGMPTLRGNHDRWVADAALAERLPSDRYARAETSAAQQDWLRALPPLLRPLPGVLAFHACPADDNAYLLEEVAAGRLALAPAAAIAARLGPATGERLVLCAHSHQPRLVHLPDGRAVVNPGSVGCPAYADPMAAEPHVSETGSPAARYALLELGPDGALLGCEFRALAYDWEAAARRAEANDSPAWAQALRSGWVTG
ncbi:metallophosphatase family protein [Siccirubricoccus sp. KC 17139]|uniref:Metallophosphatase family protein n=1 Tax=Siccirubricoccus soli TaxID=2899147 RepID=A0ABT1D783_9PROT|nr:metallophosphoesterase family protein [Siccirubricoccus soli]MCO6417787.1 metallophosphatase family protein [Siccirubricoccus soli]MCP2683922.1 metallophosphatase family protein [Siccirubricoccus soli]